MSGRCRVALVGNPFGLSNVTLSARDKETPMPFGRLLPCVCAAAFVLGACSRGDSAERARQVPTPSSVGRVDRGDSEGHEERERVRFSLRVAPGIPPATQKMVSAFLSFAVDPTAAKATRVPFTSPLVLRVNDAGRKLHHRGIRQASAWFVSDGEGKTSARFVISNSIANSQDDGVRFLASPSPVPLCNLNQDGADGVRDGSVYITLEPRAPRATSTRRRAG